MLLEERFDSGLPAGWTALDAGTGVVWRDDDPGGNGNLTGGTGGFVVVDSDWTGEFLADARLITPSLNLTGITGSELEFDTDFRAWSGGGDEIADVDLSTDGGVSWTNVWRRLETDGDFRGFVQLPIPAADNQSNVQVRFRYYDAFFDFWWQVDDVVVAGVLPNRIFEDSFESGTTSHWTTPPAGPLVAPHAGANRRHGAHRRGERPRASHHALRSLQDGSMPRDGNARRNVSRDIGSLG